MNRTLGWIISLILFVLIGAIGLYTPVFNSSLKQIQADLNKQAKTALVSGGHSEWADIRVEGQTAILSGMAPDMTARDEAVRDILQATGQRGPLVGGIARIDTKRVIIVKAPMLQDPYRFRADYQGGFVKFDFHVPNDLFRNRINNFAKQEFQAASNQYDQTILASGMPDDAWPQAIVTALKALSALDSGYLYTEGKSFKLTGASESASETLFRDIFKGIPVGYTVETDLMLQNVPITLRVNGMALADPLDWNDPIWSQGALAPSSGVADNIASNVAGGGASARDRAVPSFENQVLNSQPSEKLPVDGSDDETTLNRQEQNDADPASELKVPAPKIVKPVKPRRTISRKPSSRSVLKDSLPPRPEPKAEFSGEPMKIETTPLAITPKPSRTAAASVPSPSIKTLPIIKPVQLPRIREIDTNLGASAGSQSTRSLEPAARPQSRSMPKTYTPPQRAETDSQRAARECQNEVAMMLRSQTIEFFPTRSQFTPASRPLLFALASVLKRCDTHRIDIIGHTDNIGDVEENLILSRERAEAIAEYFSENGISETAMITAGFGETQPLTNNNSPRGRERNRRVEIIISARGV